jgi:hypothetical protein
MGGATGNAVIAADRPRLWSRRLERSSPEQLFVDLASFALGRHGDQFAGHVREARRLPWA